MKEKKLMSGSWVVVCDGNKVMILENKGDEKFPNLRSIETHTREDWMTHEMGSDQPVRIQHSGGLTRSAIETTDLHDREEQRFLEALAKRLHQNVSVHKPKHIVIVAPARALGMIRAAYSPVLKQALIAELDNDFVKMPIHEIERCVTDLLMRK